MDINSSCANSDINNKLGNIVILAKVAVVGDTVRSHQ